MIQSGQANSRQLCSRIGLLAQTALKTVSRPFVCFSLDSILQLVYRAAAMKFNRPGDIPLPASERLSNGVTICHKHRDFTTLEVPGLNYFCTVPRDLRQLALLREAVNFLIDEAKEKLK